VVFLADTSVWVDWLKGTDSPESIWLRNAIVEDFDVVVPGIVVTEVLRGVPGEREARRLEYVFGQFEPAPALDERDYREAARLYRHCRAKGVTIPSTTDCLIAQLAVRHRLTMVTRDRDFRAIARVTSLGVANLPAH
jgi:predicted nucleic acid-binding protein